MVVRSAPGRGGRQGEDSGIFLAAEEHGQESQRRLSPPVNVLERR